MVKETLRLYFQEGISDKYKKIIINQFEEAKKYFGNKFDVTLGEYLLSKKFFDPHRISFKNKNGEFTRVDSYSVLNDFWNPKDDGHNHVMIFTLEDLCATDGKGTVVASQNYGNNVGPHSIISTYASDLIHSDKPNKEILSALTSAVIGLHELGHYYGACERKHHVCLDKTQTPHCEDDECLMSQGGIHKFANNVYSKLERDTLEGVGYCKHCKEDIKKRLNTT